MGERKGQNKYYPPDFDYKKHKSLAGYHGQHPLRERARKMHLGILIIRFEMPYNIWCDGCNNHVAMGVRYNAEKSKIGMYYTTPIYKFRMKCHLCDNHYEIKTDPANHDYVIISGARRKEQRWDPHENEQIVPEDRATQKKLVLDSMYKLEHGTADQSRGKASATTIAGIVEHQAAHKDDFLLNQLARKRFREAKKVSVEAVSRDDDLKKKFSLDLKLVAESSDDAHMAELLQYSTVESYDECQKAKRQSIESRPLFSSASTTTIGTLNPSLSLSTASSSSSSGTSTSTSTAKQRKFASLGRIRQITDAGRVRQRSAAFDTSGNTTVSPLLRNIDKTQKTLGVAVRRAKHCSAVVGMLPPSAVKMLSADSSDMPGIVHGTLPDDNSVVFPVAAVVLTGGKNDEQVLVRLPETDVAVTDNGGPIVMDEARVTGSDVELCTGDRSSDGVGDQDISSEKHSVPTYANDAVVKHSGLQVLVSNYDMSSSSSGDSDGCS